MKKFISLLASWALIFLPVSMQALPLGQQVVNGTVKFNTNANTMNIAASNKAIINYNSFNINHGEVVNFLQPTSSSVVLNRVIKANPSSIMGALNANGRVFLINPAGIVFGANSIVNTNSFLATTLDIKNTDFINGNYAFSQSQNKLPSYILQKGTITVSPEGFVVLASPLVKADGLIYAKTGKIQIGAVDNFYLNFDQSGLVKFDYQPKDSTKTDVLISNDVAQSLMQDVVNNKNLEEATNIVEENGVIKLVGGSGTALVSGKLNTDGDKAGNIGIVSQNYTALLDGAKLSSNANINGNGGNIYVYSDNNAYASKGASLLSKANQGNGGTIELSAKNSVLYEGSYVDTSSVNGEFGLFYTDPMYQTISSNVNISSNYFSQATKSIVLDSGISINTNGGDITLEAPSITLNENSILQAGAGDVTLSANSAEDALIDIKDGVQITGANIELAASSYKTSQFDSDSDDPLLNQLEAVGDFIIDMPLTPIAYKDATTTSKIDIGAVTINAIDSIDISSKATSDVSVSALFEILALSYGKSSATSSLHVKSGATLTADTGDVTLKSEATSNNDVSAKATNILDNTNKQKQANFALSYSNTLTNSDAIVDSGVNITADNFKLLSTGNKDITTSATGQSLSAGTLGAAVAISDSKSNINSSLGGTINANSVEVSSTTNIERVKTFSSAGVGNGFVYKKILESNADKAAVIDKTKTLTDEKAPTTNSKSGVSKIALSAAFSYANQENNSEAKISSGAKVTSHGDVTVNSDIIYGRNGPYTQENGDVTIISDKGLKTIAIATVDSTDENTKENSFSGAVDITDVVNNSNAFIDDDAVVDAIGGKIGVYSSMYLGYLNLEWDNIKHFDGGIKDIASEAGAKVVDLVGFRGNLCTSLAQSNAQGTKNSLAGSFNIFKFTSNVDAHIGKNASINQNEGNGAVEVLTNNDIQALNFAGVIGWTYFGTKAGSTAVGGSYLNVDYASNTKAYIEQDTHVTATDLRVAAIKNGKNISISTAGGSGKNAISGSFSSLSTDDNTYAYINDAIIKTSDGVNNKFFDDEIDTNLRVNAQNNIAYVNVTGGIIKGKNIGVGVSGSINNVKRDTQAYINDSIINRTDPLLEGLDYIKAYNDGSMNSFAISGTVAAKQDTLPLDKHSTDTGDKGTFGFLVSGDASVNKIKDEANTYVKGTTFNKGAQDVKLLAKNDSDIGALSGSGAFNLSFQSAGLAGSYAGNYFFNQANAYIETSNLDVNSIDIKGQNSGIISTLSGSGVIGWGKASLAGSVSINEISNKTNSYIDKSTIVLNEDLGLNSIDDTSIESCAGALSANYGVGIGLSFAKNKINNSIASYIDYSTLYASDISIESYQKNNIKNIAASVGVSFGLLAPAGSVSVNEIDNSLDSYIVDIVNPNEIVSSGSISIASLDKSSIESAAGSVSVASTVGIGGAILHNKITNNLNSYIKGVENLQSKNLIIKSISDKEFTGITIGGAGAGATSIAGGVLINNVEDDIDAYAQDSTLKVDKSMLVHAIEQNKIRTYGGTVSGAGAVGIGGTVVRNKASSSVSTRIKDSTVDVQGSDSLDIPNKDEKDFNEVKSFNGLSVLALANEDVGTYTANASGAGTFAFAASANFNTISDRLFSYILNSSVNQNNEIVGDTNQQVLVRALSNNTLNTNAGGASGAGIAGVGGFLNNNYIQNATHAYITNNSLVDAQKLIEVRAQGTEDVTSRVVSGVGAGTVSLAGSVSLLHIANKNEANIDKGSTLSSQNDLSIISKDSTEVEALAGTLSGAGVVGVGGSVVVNSIKNSSIAHIDNSKVNAKDKLLVYSYNHAYLANDAASGALGLFGGSGVTVINTVDSITKSYTHHDDGEDILINQEPEFVADEQRVKIKAHDSVKIDDNLGSHGLGIVGAGGSVDVTTLKNYTSASLGKDTVLFAKKDLDIIAISNKDFSVESTAEGDGILGVAGSVVVANIGSSIENDAVNALANTKSILNKMRDSLGDVKLGTSSLATNTQSDLDNENNSMSVDSSFDTTSTKTNKTKAQINSNAKVNVGNDLNINANNIIANLSVKSGSTASGLIGVGGGVALVYLGADNEAYTEEGVTIDASSFTLDADYDADEIDLTSHAGSEGAVGLGADVTRFLHDYENSAIVGEDNFIVVTNGINVKSDTDEKIKGRAYGGGLGVAVAGLSKVDIDSKGITTSIVSDSSSLYAQGDEGINIISSYSIDVDSYAASAALGAGTAMGTVSDVEIRPTITSNIEDNTKLKTGIGDINIKTLSYDTLLSRAKGFNLSGLHVGQSYARAYNRAQINSLVGENALINADKDFRILTYENTYVDTGKRIESRFVEAEALSAVGTLIGKTGSHSTTSSHSHLKTEIGKNSKVNAKDDIVIKTKSYAKTKSTSNGYYSGAASDGFTGAYTYNDGDALLNIDNGSELLAKDDIFISAYAKKNAYATSFGGVGGLLSGSGTKANAQIGNIVNINVDDNTKVIANYGDVNILATGNIDTLVYSSTASLGGITSNSVKSNIDIDEQDININIGESEIVGNDVTIESMSSYLHASSKSYSKTTAAATHSRAYAYLTLASNVGVDIDGANIIGYNSVDIESIQNTDAIYAKTKATSTIGSSLIGKLYSTVKNYPTFKSDVSIKNTQIQSDTVNIKGSTPEMRKDTDYTDNYNYVKDATIINHSISYTVEEQVWDWLNGLWQLVTQTTTKHKWSAHYETRKGKFKSEKNIDIGENVSTLESPSSDYTNEYRGQITAKIDNNFNQWMTASISGQLSADRPVMVASPVAVNDDISMLSEGVNENDNAEVDEDSMLESADSEDRILDEETFDEGSFAKASEEVFEGKVFEETVSQVYVVPSTDEYIRLESGPSPINYRKIIKRYKNHPFVIIDNRIVGGKLLKKYMAMMIARIVKINPIFQFRLPKVVKQKDLLSWNE